MSTALENALQLTKAMSRSAEQFVAQKRTYGMELATPSSAGQGYFPFNLSGNSQDKYSQYRGWLYAAVHALSLEAAGQPIQVARLKGSRKREEERAAYLSREKRVLRSMPKSLESKAAVTEFEILFDDPLLDQLEKPNPIQSRWELTYNFVASLNLTGWAYLVGGYTESGKLEIYSFPTSWVTPIHENGAFQGFDVGDPNEPKSMIRLGPENVKMARLPDPGHPLRALAPSTSQNRAIQIDENIQTSQQMFFENGLFNGTVVTVGKDPHPEAPGGGLRPRLSNAQRRQVLNSIKKIMGGVMNYGEPAIVDGLIEKIERIAPSNNEMGWDKSEDKIRTRILSAFGVHPYILGEPVSVGGSRQVADIHLRFCKRVNTFLEMLSSCTSGFISDPMDGKGRVVVWWENCEYPDQQLYWLNLRSARAQGDISKNEFRAELGFPPDINDVGPRSKILDNPNGMMALATFLNMISTGSIGTEAGTKIVSLFLQIPEEAAMEIVEDAAGREVEVGGQDNQVPTQLEQPPQEDYLTQENDPDANDS